MSSLPRITSSRRTRRWSTDGSTIVLAQLGEESRRAWNRYKEVMDRLAWLGGPQLGGPQPCWGRLGL